MQFKSKNIFNPIQTALEPDSAQWCGATVKNKEMSQKQTNTQKLLLKFLLFILHWEN